MSRALSPFIRHLGEAKHRTRQLQLGVERVQAAAIAVAGEAGEAAMLRREIEAVREQLALLEALAARWDVERTEAPRRSRSAGVREEIGAWLAQGDRRAGGG